MKVTKIFVDTSTWWHWFTYKNQESLKEEYAENAKAFNQIYENALAEHHIFRFFYNSRIEDELPEKYRHQTPICFDLIKTSGLLKHVPIPLTRFDGTYKADGKSVLGGGEYGGRLRDLLCVDGYDHENKLREAVPDFNQKNPAHTKPRKKEFDIEHLESALESRADFFITDDVKTILNVLKRCVEKHPDNPDIKRAFQISSTPIDVLLKIIL